MYPNAHKLRKYIYLNALPVEKFSHFIHLWIYIKNRDVQYDYTVYNKYTRQMRTQHSSSDMHKESKETKKKNRNKM